MSFDKKYLESLNKIFEKYEDQKGDDTAVVDLDDPNVDIILEKGIFGTKMLDAFDKI